MAIGIELNTQDASQNTTTGFASKTDFDRDFSLEIAELEIVLETKCDTDLGFEAALRSALGASGNSYLFPFPANNFHKKASHVAAVRIDALDEATIAYAYECEEGGQRAFRLATAETLPEDLLVFAANYAALIVTLRPMVKAPSRGLIH